MQEEIICSLLEREEDLRVERCREEHGELAARVRRLSTDVIVRAASEEWIAAAKPLLERCPHLKVFAISASGRDAYQVELRPRVSRIRDVSSRGLVDAIRHAAETDSRSA